MSLGAVAEDDESRELADLRRMIGSDDMLDRLKPTMAAGGVISVPGGRLPSHQQPAVTDVVKHPEELRRERAARQQKQVQMNDEEQ